MTCASVCVSVFLPFYRVSLKTLKEIFRFAYDLTFVYGFVCIGAEVGARSCLHVFASSDIGGELKRGVNKHTLTSCMPATCVTVLIPLW